MCFTLLPPLPQDSFYKCNSKESKGLHRGGKNLGDSIKSICCAVLFETYSSSSLFKSTSLHFSSLFYFIFFCMTRSLKDQSGDGEATPGLFNILTGREKDIWPGIMKNRMGSMRRRTSLICFTVM